MNEKKNCKIVQDLLPNYIEKLTNEETNTFIEEHLKECDECKEMLSNMQKDFKFNSQKSDHREVKYFKKYNHKMRILKIILLIIVAIFVIRTGRNFIIISSLSNKADNYVSSTNYHKKTTYFDGTGIMIVDTYSKDGKLVSFLTRITPEETNKISIYKNGETSNLYFENSAEKTAQLHQKDVMIAVNIVNYLDSGHNLLATLLGSITSHIKTVSCNGKQCYFITNYLTANWLNSNNDGVYIDKETGLMVRETISGDTKDTIADFTHEFNTISDDIFVEPDINEYEITAND